MSNPLNDAADLINFDYSDPSRSEFQPIDLDEWWVMFANVEESTCIYIVLEN